MLSWEDLKEVIKSIFDNHISKCNKTLNILNKIYFSDAACIALPFIFAIGFIAILVYHDYTLNTTLADIDKAIELLRYINFTNCNSAFRVEINGEIRWIYDVPRYQRDSFIQRFHGIFDLKDDSVKVQDDYDKKWLATRTCGVFGLALFAIAVKVTFLN